MRVDEITGVLGKDSPVNLKLDSSDKDWLTLANKTSLFDSRKHWLFNLELNPIIGAVLLFIICR